ncbi:hypothetical protein [Streptomyces sp. NBC_00059]|nr:hypothetical protein [Streptomyces sp. NBC_00059]MCX5412350.1 hypothetical protein [Streptomyces sp. NBC_00059]
MATPKATRLRSRLARTALFALVRGTAYVAGSALAGAGLWWLQQLF